eukprot:UN04048
MMAGFLGIVASALSLLYLPLFFSRFRGISIGPSSSLSSSADKSSSLPLKSFRSASLESFHRDSGRNLGDFVSNSGETRFVGTVKGLTLVEARGNRGT